MAAAAMGIMPQTVAVGSYDAGARFTSYAPPTIPPPPPGCAPTVTQVAAASGQTVAMDKKKEGFFNGSGSGGVTFWWTDAKNNKVDFFRFLLQDASSSVSFYISPLQCILKISAVL